MELTFNKTGELYVAEFKADKEFSLHIERMNGLGSIKMQQNGAEGGKYADVEDFETRNNTKPVIEYDSGAFVAPKWIRIESSVLPTYAAITTDGDVVEIKSQAKVVEISSNGTTSVEPDAGFSYLSKVDVKVDVPSSGDEGGGESGGGSNIEYIDLTKASGPAAAVVTICSFFVKAIITSDTMGEVKMLGMSPVLIEELGASIGGRTSYIACAVDLTHRIKISMGGQVQDVTVIEYGVEHGVKAEDFDALPRITEEEFYNLNA